MQKSTPAADIKTAVRNLVLFWILTGLVSLPQNAVRAENPAAASQTKTEASSSSSQDEDDYEDEYENAAEKIKIWDPLQKLNRYIFSFNDKMYFWVMNPVAKGYAKVLPSQVRICIKNFLNNAASPVTLVNSLLQGKFKASAKTLARFGLNTTFGLLGCFDPAQKDFSLEAEDEDLGQTLGRWGIGHGFYIVIPFLGPSSLRDGLCLWGDGYFNPIDYLDDLEQYSVHALKAINTLSLNPGNYETLKKSALDPYDSFKDVYLQYREEKTKK